MPRIKPIYQRQKDSRKDGQKDGQRLEGGGWRLEISDG